MNAPSNPPAKLWVYSGECRQALCGQDAGFTDRAGKPLRTGDIVLTFTDDYVPDGLTVVIEDSWTTYNDGTHVQKDGPPEFFVMGIKSVPMHDPGQWRVKLMKRFEDVVPGEHWPEYGFNYRSEP